MTEMGPRMDSEYEFDTEPRRSRFWLWAPLTVLAAFAGGVFLMGWLVTHDARTARLLHLETAEQAKAEAVLAQKVVIRPVPVPVVKLPGGVDPQMTARVETLEGKVADIETQAKEATGDASRAEGLLVAFAARRALDQGVGLGYIEGLLRERFGGTQPQAVGAILTAARTPVTLADLQNGLDAIAPVLAQGGTPDESWWESFHNALTGLVVVRRAGEPSTLPADRVARAQRLLEAGQVDGALAEIARLTDHHAADKWIVGARRYLVGRAALDQIETAALLDPTTGGPIAVPRPATTAPAPAAVATPTTSASD
jgi:hypothetical protein